MAHNRRNMFTLALLIALGMVLDTTQARHMPAYTQTKPKYGHSSTQLQGSDDDMSTQGSDDDMSMQMMGGYGYTGSGSMMDSSESDYGSMEDEINAQFDMWNAQLRSLDPERVASMYAPNAVLLPTLSGIVRYDHEGIADYFKGFLKKKPQGVINESITHILSPTTATRSGIYTFTFNQNGKKSTAKARFTFNYVKMHGVWLILSHHSSVLPKDE